MFSYLGFDTSNYTTSTAVYFSDGTVKHARKLLPVKKGEKGLRQSDAVFYHVNRLPEVLNEISTQLIDLPHAIGVSARPRDEQGSYMPCFSVGTSCGKILSSILKIPCFEFSHQAGHIVAALYSANRLDILKREFLAFHVSGGTTEAILVMPDESNVIKTKIVAKSLDLNAGQLVDRVGVMLGLDFPAGEELEKLALMSDDKFNINIKLKGFDCCLSGVENMCTKMKSDGCNQEKIARFCIEYISGTVDKMCEQLLNVYDRIPMIFAGGVMSNFIIRQRLEKKYNAVFAQKELSSDNAVGIAVLAAIKAGEVM